MSGSHGEYTRFLQYWVDKQYKSKDSFSRSSLVNFHHLFGNGNIEFFRLFGFSEEHRNESLKVLNRITNLIKSNPLVLGRKSKWENSVSADNWNAAIHSHEPWDEDGFLRDGESGILEGIPAGYTYLWQIALHDVSHTSVPVIGFKDSSRPIVNRRSV
ncbi:MAG: hypothetical protein AAGF59_06525, partial [Pseudomonadota bacterium]